MLKQAALRGLTILEIDDLLIDNLRLKQNRQL
jgi:hypothetical protein